MGLGSHFAELTSSKAKAVKDRQPSAGITAQSTYAVHSYRKGSVVPLE